MKETTIGASEFKAKCLQLLDDVAEEGTTLVITKHGKPVAKLMPVSPSRTLLGSWKGIVKIKEDIVNFSEADDWEDDSHNI